MNATVPLARELGEHLIRLLREKFHNLQSMSIMSPATLLDQATTGFFSPTKANEAVKRLTSECANIIRTTHPQPSPAAASSSSAEEAVIERPVIIFLWFKVSLDEL